MLSYSTKGLVLTASGDFSAQRAYRRLAPLYDLWAGLTESRATERALEWAAPQAGDWFLEVAVGTGRLFAEIVRTPGIGRAVGLDLSPSMVRRARTRLLRADRGKQAFCLGDSRLLPFADRSFDLVANCYMLDLLEESDLTCVLAEFARVLKPSGRLVLVNMAKLGSWLNPAWMWLYRHAPSLVGGCRPVPQVGPLLAAGGWQIAEHEVISQHGFWSELFLARRAARGV